MSRRFSNLQYISIGILFGTCVFLWTRKLNLTKTFPSDAAGNLRQVARNENEQLLIDSWANRIEEERPTNLEDGEEIVNGQEEDSNDQIHHRDANVLDEEKFPINSPNTSQEVEEVVDVGSPKTNSDETGDKTQSPEPIESSVSDTVDTQTENTVYSEDSSSVSSAISSEMSPSISTITNSVINPLH